MSERTDQQEKWRYIILMIGHANSKWDRLKYVIECHIRDEKRKTKGISEWYEDCLKEVIKLEIDCLEQGKSLRAYMPELKRRAGFL
jgi:hypothetical protein